MTRLPFRWTLSIFADGVSKLISSPTHPLKLSNLLKKQKRMWIIGFQIAPSPRWKVCYFIALFCFRKSGAMFSFLQLYRSQQFFFSTGNYKLYGRFPGQNHSLTQMLRTVNQGMECTQRLISRFYLGQHQGHLWDTVRKIDGFTKCTGVDGHIYFNALEYLHSNGLNTSLVTWCMHVPMYGDLKSKVKHCFVIMRKESILVTINFILLWHTEIIVRADRRQILFLCCQGVMNLLVLESSLCNHNK